MKNDGMPTGGSPSPTHQSGPPVERGRVIQESRPLIDVGDRDLPSIMLKAWAALGRINEPPLLFRQGNRLVRLDGQSDVVRLADMDIDGLTRHLARAALWWDVMRGRSEYPPTRVVRCMLAEPNPPLPPLQRIVRTPVFAADGALQTKPGYAPRSQTYFWPHCPSVTFRVPLAPTRAAIERARILLVEDLMGDFPFVAQADLAHAVALLALTPVRDMIDGPTPLHLIEKPSPGTGASLLVEVITSIAVGAPAAAMTASGNLEEMRKRITAGLRSGPAVLLWDNLRPRLDSDALAAALTADVWEDRMLGHSTVVRLPVRCAWVATANNPTLSPEIERRTVRVRLDAQRDQPWLRPAAGFRHPDLREWVREHRTALGEAVLTLVQAWIAQGQPVPTDVPSLGMYEGWRRTMAGILHVAGIPGFLNTVNMDDSATDPATSAMRAFVAAWLARFGEGRVTVSDLYAVAVDCALPIDLGGQGEHVQKIRLGQFLAAHRDQVIGAMRLVQDGSKRRAMCWRLIIIKP